MTIVNAHTHQPGPDALISVSPLQFNPQPGLFYSVGYHPWWLNSTTAPQVFVGDDGLSHEQIAALTTAANHPQVLAIGETGLDSLHGPALQQQLTVLRQHIAVAQQLNLPVVMHCVRTAQQFAMLSQHAPGHTPWIVHGFRQNANVARTLIAAGFYLSVGASFNAEALRAIPLDRLLIETDDDPQLTIAQVASNVAQALSTDGHTVTAQQVTEVATRNASALFKAE